MHTLSRYGVASGVSKMSKTVWRLSMMQLHTNGSLSSTRRRTSSSVCERGDEPDSESAKASLMSPSLRE
jgi:hypothetical protein